jgi:pimeloyl-ACP methyl ester carboxylesterase
VRPEAPDQPARPRDGITVGLVHGAWHGAWCWERLAPRLSALGYRVAAMDLPCEDPLAGATRYAEVVDQALPPGGDLVLIGHSLGGLTIPLVAARRPVRLLVFLCAAVPVFGQSLEEQVAAHPEMYAPGFAGHPERVVHSDRSVSWGSRAAVQDVFYHDCDPAEVDAAWLRLRRQAAAPRRERCPLTGWPPGARASIHASEDRAIAPAWSRRAATELLGVEPLELPGGHSPFLSRPQGLARLLDHVITTTRPAASPS